MANGSVPAGPGSGIPRIGRRGVSTLAVIAGVAVLPLLLTSTWAAWTASHASAPSTLSTSTILLQDDQGAQAGSATSSGTALFNVSNLEPNSAATTACIGVVFAGTGSATGLTLSATLGGAGQAALQSQLKMTAATYNTSGTVAVTGGTNTNSGSCTNYPAGGTDQTIGTQGATLQSWAAGGPYSIAAPVTNTWYLFTVSGLPPAASACATYCSQTITIALTWTLTTT